MLTVAVMLVLEGDTVAAVVVAALSTVCVKAVSAGE
jgi:hypothetical protein